MARRRALGLLAIVVIVVVVACAIVWLDSGGFLADATGVPGR